MGRQRSGYMNTVTPRNETEYHVDEQTMDILTITETKPGTGICCCMNNTHGSARSRYRTASKLNGDPCK